MFKIVLVIIFVSFYAHLYIHFMINPNNECSFFNEMTKEEVTNAVYTKQPFVFDATKLTCSHELKEKKSDKKYDQYDVSYISHPILEPFVRFFPKVNVFECKKKKRWTETNSACRTYYKITKGTIHVTCIHPKYINKKMKLTKRDIKENENFIRLTLHADSILFLPNYWYVYIDPLDKSVLEKTQYFTPLNKIAIAISKILN